MEFSRQKYWSGYPFSSPGDFPDPVIKPRSPEFQADSLPSESSAVVRYNCLKKKKRNHFLYHLVTSEVPIPRYFTDLAVFVHLFPIMKSELSLTIWMNSLPTHTCQVFKDCVSWLWRVGPSPVSNCVLNRTSFSFDFIQSYMKAVWEEIYESFLLEEEEPRATSKEQQQQKLLNVKP